MVGSLNGSLIWRVVHLGIFQRRESVNRRISDSAIERMDCDVVKRYAHFLDWGFGHYVDLGTTRWIGYLVIRLIAIWKDHCGGLNLSLVFWWKSPKRPKFNNVLVKTLHKKSQTVKFEDFLMFTIIAISSSFWCFRPQKQRAELISPVLSTPL